jgi:hypothetical protein
MIILSGASVSQLFACRFVPVGALMMRALFLFIAFLSRATERFSARRYVVSGQFEATARVIETGETDRPAMRPGAPRYDETRFVIRHFKALFGTFVGHDGAHHVLGFL